MPYNVLISHYQGQGHLQTLVTCFFYVLKDLCKSYCVGTRGIHVLPTYLVFTPGVHRSIEISTMIVGHTKFDPDWHFGVWKLKWRSSSVETLQEVAATVTNSSRRGHNVPQLVKDDDRPVQFYQWRTYLQRYFKTLKGLTQYHHFFVTADMPGVIVCKVTPSSVPVSVDLRRRHVQVPVLPAMPSLDEVPGMDLQRQWYLYDQIREFCTSSTTKDITCPKPVEPKPKLSHKYIK
jgi:hypothetical protein